MPLADCVETIGFRKWYERKLLASHAHMVLAVLAVIAMIGSMEAFRQAGSTDLKAANVLFVLTCAMIGFWALRRYLFLLMRAEGAANQASCPGCGVYARFRLVRRRAEGDIDVACLKCAREWPIDGNG